jgi:hypothetical protein
MEIKKHKKPENIDAFFTDKPKTAPVDARPRTINEQ